MTSFLQEFRAFILRGNIIDLAVAVIIGTAFGLVVTSFTRDIALAIIAVIVGKPDFTDVTLTLNGGVIGIGSFITAIVNFLLVAVVVFLALKALTAAQTLRRKAETDADTPTPSDEVVLLTEIRDLLVAGGGARPAGPPIP